MGVGKMIRLTTSFSNPLVELIQSNNAPIDAIQVGEYLGVAKLIQCQKLLPEWQFHFHANRLGIKPRTIAEFKTCLHYTQSPWASVHLALLPSYLVRAALRFGWYLPAPNPDRLTREYVKRVMELRAAIDVPLILENMPSFPYSSYESEADPERITEILETTNCNLLLDIAHARIAAQIRRIDVCDYLNSLPLRRVRQIHVSGSRMRNGYLYDAHEPLEEFDYTLLEWVLERTQPQILTLEYQKEREALQEQLMRLRCTLEGATVHEC